MRRAYDALNFMVFLRIPPFPGARSGPVQMAALGVSACTVTAREVATELAAHRVGGAFWGARPPLPLVAGRLVVRGGDVQGGDGQGCDVGTIAGVTVHVDHRGRMAGQRAECDPWHLATWAQEVCAPLTSDIGLVALLLGKPLHLPDGTLAAAGALETALGARLINGQAFRDPYSGKACSVREAIRLLGFWRGLIDANRPLDAVCGVAFWKQQTLAPLLWGGDDVPFARRPAPQEDRTFAVWRARTPERVLEAIESSGCGVLEIEDGFVRSTGLGANCVPPLSIVVDAKGAHFDPSQPTDLEGILAHHSFSDDERRRASALRQVLVGGGISKYAIGHGEFARSGGNRRHILVVGQVEDDRSWLKGGGGIASNLELLQRVRACNPDAWLIFRPHPDVMAGHRKGHVPPRLARQVADEIAAHAPITALVEAVDEVHVLTSLTGFEALLRGRSVTTWGVPFYAGWGLTTDLGPVPARRGRRLMLNELVAAALLLYPRYLDPVTMLPCPPEVTVQRLIEGTTPRGGALVGLRRLSGRAAYMLRRLAALFRHV